MSKEKNFLEEINKLAGSAFSSAVHAKDSLVEFIRQNVEAMMKSRDTVLREEFEALKSMVVKLQKKDSKKKSDGKQKKQTKKDPEEKKK